MKYLIISILMCTSLQASNLKLIGKSLLEFSVFQIDVYEISFYQGKNGQEEIHLDYKIDVDRKYSIAGWNRGLEKISTGGPKLKSKIEWILKYTYDYKKGDKVILRRINDKVSLIQNNKLIAQIHDKLIATIIFEPWIGKNPIDDNIKSELLGRN
jgi:hypothetical protein